MSAEIHDSTTHEVTPDAAREELEHLLDDPRFRVTTRQREILRYLAERRFAGCEESVKAYSIALDVLGRPSGFDAANDPIVRIEISRLRAGLHAFYEAFGSDHAVSIHIPKGTYLACFSQMLPEHEPDDPAEGVACATMGHDAENHDLQPAHPSLKHRLLRVKVLAPLLLVSAAAGVCIMLAANLIAVEPAISRRPTVYVSMQAAEDGLQGEASVTRDMLLTALTAFQTLTVARINDTEFRPLDAASRVYDLDLKYYGDEDDRTVWWQVVDKASGDLLKAGLQKFDRTGKSDRAVREELVDELARRLASPRGVISTVEMRSASETTIGNACVLRAEYSLDEGGSELVTKARACLERTLSYAPDDPDALALMARSLLYTPDVDNKMRGKAMDYARRAVSIAPLSDRAQVALMIAHFAQGRTELAHQAGNRAAALNSHNPDTMAKLGIVLYAAGYRDAAIAMAQDAGRGMETVPRDALLVLALNAYNQRRFSEASLLAEQINRPSFIVRALQVAALGQLNSAEAKVRLADFRSKYADFERRFHPQLLSTHLDDRLSSELETGLTKAGASFDFQNVGSIR